MQINPELCACCQAQIISETNSKAQFLDLCDDCFRKLNVDPQSEIIGYRKGEQANGITKTNKKWNENKTNLGI